MRMQQDAGKADVVAAREEKRERACRHGEIIRVALLETERARRVAAEMLEGESGEDRRGGDDEHESAGPQHHAAAAGARIGLPDASISEGIFGDEEAADHRGKETGGDQRQPLLDEAADRLAIDGATARPRGRSARRG